MFGCYYKRTTELHEAVYNSLVIRRIISLICMAAPKHFFDLSVCFYFTLFIVSPDREEEIMITEVHIFSGWDESVLVIHLYKQCTVYGNNAAFHCTKVGQVAKLLFTEICKISPFYNCGAASALTVCACVCRSTAWDWDWENKFTYSDNKSENDWRWVSRGLKQFSAATRKLESLKQVTVKLVTVSFFIMCLQEVLHRN